MAIALDGGHAKRALDFFNTKGKYFALGGTSSWSTKDEVGGEVPDTLIANSYKLNGLLGLKKVDNEWLVIEYNGDDDTNTITYRNKKWKKIAPAYTETTTTAVITKDASTVKVASTSDFLVGEKIRISYIYEANIVSIDTDNKTFTLDTPAPENISIGATVVRGATVAGAHHIYLDCYLNYDNFPLGTYRQVGLCTGVPTLENDDQGNPRYKDILVADDIAALPSLGNLEILDNRYPSTRNQDQRELLSVIIEF